MNVIQKWKNKYKNEVRVDNNVITLSGVIANGWYGDISPSDVRDLVSNISGDIVIRLNSPGGSAFDGIEIYNTLKELPNKVTVEVTALAASAATFICMAADEVVMCTGSQMMIHNAWTYAEGNAEELMSVADELKTIDNSIKQIYSERTGIDIDNIAAYMAEEKLWTADEAIEKGFADKKKDAGPSNEKVDYDVIAQFVNKAVEEKLNSLKEKNGQPDNKGDGSILVPKNKLKTLLGGK